MLLTLPQRNRFWRDWSVACKLQGWTKAASWTDAQIDNERHQLLERAGFDSLTLVDPGPGFDRVLAELALLTKPDDLNAQLRQKQMPRLRLLHSLHKLDSQFSKGEFLAMDSFSAYARAIMTDRFGHNDVDRLSLEQLEQLRNTLANRAAVKRKVGRASRLSPQENPF